jgi:hypothetical protein
VTTAVPVDTQEPSAATEQQTAGRASGSVLGAAIASEWTKLRSVRSTMWALLATVGITIGLACLFCAAYVARYDRLGPREIRSIDPTVLSLRGLFLGVLALGVLGVLVMTSEYATGMIRATLTAVPQRRTLLAAKTIVFGAVALVVSMASAFVAFSAGQAILSKRSLGASFGDPNVLRAVLGAGAYLTAVGLLGLALGAILRRTAGAVATLVGLVFVADLLIEALPSPWNDDISKFLPGRAGLALFTVRPDSTLLSAGSAFIVLIAWLVVAYTVAAVLLTRRDA